MRSALPRLSEARVLVSNDDGVHAPGLKALVAVMEKLCREVWVVAPETEQSAASHSLTIHAPLRSRQLGPRRYAVSGTPTDCIVMAMGTLIGEHRPDFVVSGFNDGRNLGEDVIYSGTVAAAMEATLLGWPAIAFSQVAENGRLPCWETAMAFTPLLLERLAEFSWPPDVLLNVNFPSCAPHRVRGVRVTSQGRCHAEVALRRCVDPRGRDYYWVDNVNRNAPLREGSDISAIHHDSVSVTPLHLNLTHAATSKALERLFASRD